jgi:hypothetical protein
LISLLKSNRYRIYGIPATAIQAFFNGGLIATRVALPGRKSASHPYRQWLGKGRITVIGQTFDPGGCLPVWVFLL